MSKSLAKAILLICYPFPSFTLNDRPSKTTMREDEEDKREGLYLDEKEGCLEFITLAQLSTRERERERERERSD